MKSSKGSGTSSLWGELPVRETLKQEVITPDIIENIWRQVMDDTNKKDSEFPIDKHFDYVQLPMGNIHVLNTINLHHQRRMLESGTIHCNNSEINLEESQSKKPEVLNPFNFIEPRKKVMVRDPSTKYHLTPETAHNILKHAVIVLLAHIGFETASNVGINMLTDVADHFLRRITLLLKVASEQAEHGFPDAMERVLLEAGVGGIVSLHDYYQDYVIRFEENMKKKVIQLAKKQKQKQKQLEFNACSTKEVPTLQLLDPEMGFTPSLDAGFQMLHSLEQDQLHSLEGEEDVGASDSPGIVQRAEIPPEKKRKLIKE
ncbi:STAGA complex 65 subunit gamma-like isoform X2 [Prorops nasuta]|uniref:STAGA complex 65 subunit gamma-like isoform X2 n=1 Tax=Prorops nasuta TaxID=863751 RepID=UPI0034CE23EC